MSLKRFARDPLVVFLSIGLLLFLLAQFAEPDDARVIEILPTEVDVIASQWREQMGRDPLAEELTGLINARVQERMLFLEAERLGLAEDDVIIRRRMIQKLRFLVEDSAVVEPASNEVLKAYFNQNQSRYVQPSTFSFSHVFFATDSVSDDMVTQDLLRRLNAGEPSEMLGDPFMLGREFKAVDLQRIADGFGDRFVNELNGLAADSVWRGPVASHYGIHLVRIDRKIPARQEDFDSAIDRVRSDFDLERRDQAFQTYLANLRDQYNVALP